MDISTIVAATLGGVGGGVGGGSLLLYIIKSQGQSIRDNSKEISNVRKDLGKELGQVKRDSHKAHLKIYERIESEEDCVEEELQKLNRSISEINSNLKQVITVIKLTSNDEVRNALGGM